MKQLTPKLPKLHKFEVSCLRGKRRQKIVKNDQFGCKRCQKKRKDVDYKLLSEFFQKYFVVHEQSAVENSFSTYVCYFG